jgi:hypothetical protein
VILEGNPVPLLFVINPSGRFYVICTGEDEAFVEVVIIGESSTDDNNLVKIWLGSMNFFFICICVP